MHHFFVDPGQVSGEEIFVTGSDVNHMKNVLRIKAEELVEISDGGQWNYLCRVTCYEEERAVLSICERQEADRELPSRLYLFQGLPKSDKMEMIIQKAVELGAYEVIPVETKRSVVRLDEKKAAKKLARWQAIAESGAKQSGRSMIPDVHPVMDFESALSYAEELDVRLIPYELAEGMEETRRIVGEIKPGQSVGIFIGPEGGFEKAEVEKAMAQGVRPVTLGKRILRTETAGLTMLSILMFQLEGGNGFQGNA